MPEREVASPKHIQRGAAGERRAIEALQKRGYRLIETNWRCVAGELDAIMQDGNELVFIEVKTRTGSSHGTAEQALTPAKARKLVTAAEWYLAEHPELGDAIWRIDLVAITLDRSGNPTRFTHIANAALTG